MPRSRHPARAARQQANLESGQHAGNLEPGAGRWLRADPRVTRHGAYSEALVANVEAEVREIMDALGCCAAIGTLSDGWIYTARSTNALATSSPRLG